MQAETILTSLSEEHNNDYDSEKSAIVGSNVFLKMQSELSHIEAFCIKEFLSISTKKLNFIKMYKIANCMNVECAKVEGRL